MKILICETVVSPRYVKIGSKTDDSLVHDVVPSTVWNDPLCDCRGYLFRGYCSHIDQVEEDKCTWWTEDLNYDGICPKCGAKLIEFEMEPTYE